MLRLTLPAAPSIATHFTVSVRSAFNCFALFISARMFSPFSPASGAITLYCSTLAVCDSMASAHSAIIAPRNTKTQGSLRLRYSILRAPDQFRYSITASPSSMARSSP